jgi:hypothetical protein
MGDGGLEVHSTILHHPYSILVHISGTIHDAIDGGNRNRLSIWTAV